MEFSHITLPVFVFDTVTKGCSYGKEMVVKVDL